MRPMPLAAALVVTLALPALAGEAAYRPPSPPGDGRVLVYRGSGASAPSAVPVYRGSAAAPGNLAVRVGVRGAVDRRPPVWFVDPAQDELVACRLSKPSRSGSPASAASSVGSRCTERLLSPRAGRARRRRAAATAGRPAEHAVLVLDQELEHSPRHPVVLVQPPQAQPGGDYASDDLADGCIHSQVRAGPAARWGRHSRSACQIKPGARNRARTSRASGHGAAPGRRTPAPPDGPRPGRASRRA